MSVYMFVPKSRLLLLLLLFLDFFVLSPIYPASLGSRACFLYT